MSECKSCGKKMHWGTTPEGKKIPLDAVAPVYHLAEDGTAHRLHDAHVTHFATCPSASQHSKKKKEESK